MSEDLSRMCRVHECANINKSLVLMLSDSTSPILLPRPEDELYVHEGWKRIPDFGPECDHNQTKADECGLSLRDGLCELLKDEESFKWAVEDSSTVLWFILTMIKREWLSAISTRNELIYESLAWNYHSDGRDDSLWQLMESFVCSFFGMNLSQIVPESPLPLWNYFAVAAPVTLISLIIVGKWTTVKHVWNYWTTVPTWDYTFVNRIEHFVADLLPKQATLMKQSLRQFLRRRAHP